MHDNKSPVVDTLNEEESFKNLDQWYKDFLNDKNENSEYDHLFELLSAA